MCAELAVEGPEQPLPVHDAQHDPAALLVGVEAAVADGAGHGRVVQGNEPGRGDRAQAADEHADEHEQAAEDQQRQVTVPVRVYPQAERGEERHRTDEQRDDDGQDVAEACPPPAVGEHQKQQRQQDAEERLKRHQAHVQDISNVHSQPPISSSPDRVRILFNIL